MRTPSLAAQSFLLGSQDGALAAPGAGASSGCSARSWLQSRPVERAPTKHHVRRFAIDPDGWAWIEPNHRDPALPEIEVLRVHLASGRSHLATVPVFPGAFRPDGRLVGVRRMRETGEVRVMHVGQGDS